MVAPEQTYAGKQIGIATTGVHMSLEEFDSIAEWDDAFRYELVNGLLIVSPAADASVRFPNEWLGCNIRMSQEESRGERSIATVYEENIHTSRGVRRVDRAVWLGLDGLPKMKVDVPTILIDFVSTGRRHAYRDYAEKRDEYLAIGVKEYWVIDRFDRTLTAFSGSPDSPSEQVVREPDVYTTTLLPGFGLPLRSLFEVAEHYSG